MRHNILLLCTLSLLLSISSACGGEETTTPPATTANNSAPNNQMAEENSAPANNTDNNTDNNTSTNNTNTNNNPDNNTCTPQCGARTCGDDGCSGTCGPGCSGEQTCEAGQCVEPPDEIWSPSPGTSWQWQLQGDIDTSYDVDMYDIDLFDVPTRVIDGLHADGRIVICYFSAGSYEEWRDDAGEFPRGALGDPLDDWPGERWVDIRDGGVRAIMQARLDLAAQKGCDGVEPDNIDGYTNETGYNLSGQDQLDYNRFLASEAHARGLSIGLKNDVDQVSELVGDFDWALNEECFEYNECETLLPFINAGKAVFNVEYGGRGLADRVCSRANDLDFDTLIKDYDLRAEPRISCR